MSPLNRNLALFGEAPRYPPLYPIARQQLQSLHRQGEKDQRPEAFRIRRRLIEVSEILALAKFCAQPDASIM
jgi:hypothetical protein